MLGRPALQLKVYERDEEMVAIEVVRRDHVEDGQGQRERKDVLEDELEMEGARQREQRCSGLVVCQERCLVQLSVIERKKIKKKKIQTNLGSPTKRANGSSWRAMLMSRSVALSLGRTQMLCAPSGHCFWRAHGSLVTIWRTGRQ